MEKYAFFLTDHISFVFLTFYFVLGYSQLGFPWWLSSKESAYDAEDAECPRFDPWIGKIPWRRAWQSTPVLLPGESHRQRSLAGYSPWACEESDTTEVTNTHSQLTGNVVIVSGEQQRVSAIHAHICILPQTLLPFLDFISIFSKLPCFTTWLMVRASFLAWALQNLRSSVALKDDFCWIRRTYKSSCELPSFQPHLLGLFHSKSRCGYSDLMLKWVSEICMVCVLQTIDSL